MELNEVITKRRTVRDFKAKPVEMEIIRQAISDGFKAPSYNHLREWDFLIIQTPVGKSKLIASENLDKVVDINHLNAFFANEDPVMREMYLDAIPKQKKMMLEAPVVIVVVYKPKTPFDRVKRVYDLNCMASAWCCIENVLLSLAANDVYGVTFIPQHTDVLKENLGIPNHLEIAAVIPVGYAAEDAKVVPQKDVNVDARIHFERWSL